MMATFLYPFFAISWARAKERPSVLAAGPEEILVAFLAGHAGGIHSIGEHDDILFFRKLLHGRADGASRAAAEELHAVFQDQVLSLTGRHIRFQFRIDRDNFHFLAQKSAAFIDHFNGILHAIEIAFADILEGSRKRLRRPDLNGVLSCCANRQRQHQDHDRKHKP